MGYTARGVYWVVDGLFCLRDIQMLCVTMNSEYFRELRKLSLTAREAVALLVCEQYFHIHNLHCDETREFLSYMWEWPIISDFESWEKRRPLLVNFGLGNDLSNSMTKTLASASIEEGNFRLVVGGTVEILWGSFWGAAEDDASFNSLNSMIQASGLKQYPVLTPFKFSVYADGDGWGNSISIQDRNFWRKSAVYA